VEDKNGGFGTFVSDICSRV